MRARNTSNVKAEAFKVDVGRYLFTTKKVLYPAERRQSAGTNFQQGTFGKAEIIPRPGCTYKRWTS
jgi:hypothetical protein